MNLPYRIELLVRLGEYIRSDDEGWQQIKIKAGYENGWFIPEFVDLSIENIAQSFLQKDILEKWAENYKPAYRTGRLQTINHKPLSIGIVMAGNIPLVGFHDLLCVFISGHKAMIKLSSKDKVLIKHLTEKFCEWEPGISDFIQYSEMLKGCDAYIATGSNNSSRYFDYYFGKYPHIIRRNRTSVAILTGKETKDDLENLSDDVYQYFGLGCRNVTKVYVPKEYDFIPLLEADHHKYKNNYDYNLALHLLNKKYYMTNGSILLIEDAALFSPISQLNYEFYDDREKMTEILTKNTDLQCIVGNGFIHVGKSQSPSINEYADGVDTLKFLSDL
jgi:hypothetical protein